MAQLTIEVNGRPYLVGCEDGQENHLRELARLFDSQVTQLAGSVGSLGETRLFLMGALMMADELADTRARLALAQADVTKLRQELHTVENRAGAALDAAAQRIEALASAAQPSGMLM
jgi:cell division protein ZapA